LPKAGSRKIADFFGTKITRQNKAGESAKQFNLKAWRSKAGQGSFPPQA
jgi:hypothetical protein